MQIIILYDGAVKQETEAMYLLMQFAMLLAALKLQNMMSLNPISFSKCFTGILIFLKLSNTCGIDCNMSSLNVNESQRHYEEKVVKGENELLYISNTLQV